MVFVVIEGFSGSGKTTIAKLLEKEGWTRIPESAQMVPRSVPLADRADTAADLSLFGATLTYSSTIARTRNRRRLVAEGYLLSDLAYAKVRQELSTSEAYPAMLALCRRALVDHQLRPDLYVVLRAAKADHLRRQSRKDDREKNLSEFFRRNYYSALDSLHRELNERNVVKVRTEGHPRDAVERIRTELRSRRLVEK